MNLKNDYKFVRHPVEAIYVNNLLGNIRKRHKPYTSDKIVVQSVLEIYKDIREYGGFKIEKRPSYDGEYIRVYYDCRLVIAIEITDTKVYLSFIRDNEDQWKNELFALAESHATIVLS